MTNVPTQISNSSEVKASRIFGLLPVSTINKNKIKIVPIAKATNLLDVVEPDTSNGLILKTSITVNSGECLSTVNVGDGVGKYHSSVLIKNNSDKISDINNQKAFEQNINIESANKASLQNVSVAENATTEIAIVYHSKSRNLSQKNEIVEMISTNVNKTKTLICLDYKNDSDCNNEQSSTKTGLSGYTVQNTTDDGSLILKLLDDPYLSHLLYGLEITTIANIIENSRSRLHKSKYTINTRSTKDDGSDKLFLNCLYDIIKEERSRYKINEVHII